MTPPADRPARAAPRRAGATARIPADREGLRRAVLAWFAVHGRSLAFRSGPPDPWSVLVAEVMAQQTQVARVEERLPAFLGAFPTPGAMAAASPADVIRAWRGLGYNRRAVALHRAAVAIAARGGDLPSEPEALQALPGVGPYTARAVAAVAFGRPVGAVDVNVRRVVGRFVTTDPAGPPAAALQAAADALVDPLQPGVWTHALMDLGATVCRPARPACPACPARPWCATGRAVGPAPAETRAAARAASLGGSAATPARSPRPGAAARFEATSRWLRGRIVDRLRDAPAGWAVTFDGPLGSHSRAAVLAALVALARDGIVEHDGAGRARLVGPVADGPGR